MKQWKPFLAASLLGLFCLMTSLRGEINGIVNTTDVGVSGRGTNAAALVSWWKLDGGKANTAIDSSTNQATGTFVNGAVTDADGQILGSSKQAGGTSGINIGKCGANSGITTNTAPWTISLWFKTTNTVSQYMYSEGNSTNAAGNQFIGLITSRSTAGDYAFSMRYDNGSGLLIMSTTAATGTNSNNNQWHLLTVTHPAQTNWVMYVDGGFRLTNNTSAASVVNLTLDHAAIGYLRRNTQQSQFVGNIDDVRIYNRILEVQEITNLYNKIAP